MFLKRFAAIVIALVLLVQLTACRDEAVHTSTNDPHQNTSLQTESTTQNADDANQDNSKDEDKNDNKDAASSGITSSGDNKNPISISSNEVSISTKMAQLLGVGVGDTIKWHIVGSDKWISTKVDKIHSDPTSQGIIVSKEKLDDLGLNYTATSVISSHGVDKNYSGVKTIFSMDSLTDSWDDMMESSMTIIYLLAAFASLLSVIVLYNLGLLSFTEIKREFATLKVLGFKSSQLRKLLLTQNLWFTTIGFVIGVPLGREVLQYLWGTMGDSFYLKATISIKTLIITFIITYVVSILVNLMFSGKIKKLNMVESLKDNE